MVDVCPIRAALLKLSRQLTNLLHSSQLSFNRNINLCRGTGRFILDHCENEVEISLFSLVHSDLGPWHCLREPNEWSILNFPALARHSS